MLRWAIVILVSVAVRPAFGQLAPAPETPEAPPTNVPTVHVVRPTSSRVVVVPSTPATNRVITPRPIPASYRPMPEDLLAWDSETQVATVKYGAPAAVFTFQVTNVSDQPVSITSVRTSCGCTAAKLPPMPWTLAPGTNSAFDVTMKVAGKTGTVVKTVTITTDQGFKTLYVRTIIEEAEPGAMGQADRMKNLRIATANRQAVFQGDCAECHATPALNKTGGELFSAACAICHEAEHRASMVPDLRNLQKETNAEYWRTWITSSADGKLMPAFALEHGGILNTMQIDSLVNYLVENFPTQQPGQAAPAAAPATH